MFLAWRENKDVFLDVAAYEDAAIAHRPRFFLVVEASRNASRVHTSRAISFRRWESSP
jgi:hypothetical protein